LDYALDANLGEHQPPPELIVFILEHTDAFHGMIVEAERLLSITHDRDVWLAEGAGRPCLRNFLVDLDKLGEELHLLRATPLLIVNDL
jgi:hypothetical protein